MTDSLYVLLHSHSKHTTHTETISPKPSHIKNCEGCVVARALSVSKKTVLLESRMEEEVMQL